MTLLFYDFEFNLLLAEPKLVRSKWTVYFNGVGSFEAHLPLSSEAVRLVTDNKYLVAVQDGLSAIIVGMELKDELVIYGRTCNWLLSKRITPEFEAVTGKAGALAKGFVSTAFSDVENFVSGTIYEGDSIEFESRQATTLEVVTNCLGQEKLGHRVSFDILAKQWVFDVLKGSENDLIMSEANKNAYDTRILADILDLATCGRFYQETESGFESTVLEGDKQKTGIFRWEAELDGKTSGEAAVSLGKMAEKNEITLKARNAVFGKDYDLGDIVRVQIIKGEYRTTVKKRISGVEIRFVQGACGEQPIFEEV